MAIEYLGLSSVNGPFVVLEGVQGASFDEVVEITVDNGGLPERKLGRVVEINEDKAVVQVFKRPKTCLFRTPIPVSPVIPWKSGFPKAFWEEPLTGSENLLIIWEKSWLRKERM